MWNIPKAHVLKCVHLFDAIGHVRFQRYDSINGSWGCALGDNTVTQNSLFPPGYYEAAGLLPTHSSNDVQCCLGLKAGRESNFGIRTSESLDHGKPFLLPCGMYPGFCYSNANSYHIRTRNQWDCALSSTRCFCCDGGLTRSCACFRCHHSEVVRYRSVRA